MKQHTAACLPTLGREFCQTLGHCFAVVVVGAIKPMSQFMLQCLQVLMRRFNAIQCLYSASSYCFFFLPVSKWFISKYLLCYQVLLTASNDIPRMGWHSAQKGAFLLEGVCQQKKLEETRRKLYRYGVVWVNPCWSFDHATTSSFQKLYGAITLRPSFNLLQPEETCGRRGKPSLPIRASSRTQLGMLKPGHCR